MKLNKIYLRAGTTRSGKMIPYATAAEELGAIAQYFKDCCFSSDDLLDAVAVFDYLSVRGIRRNDTAIFDRHADGIRNIFSSQELSDARDRANVKSAFDLRDLGKSLAAVEFADF
jgi:hypothetical protein